MVDGFIRVVAAISAPKVIFESVWSKGFIFDNVFVGCIFSKFIVFEILVIVVVATIMIPDL
jgi:uncharacterized membrane protein